WVASSWKPVCRTTHGGLGRPGGRYAVRFNPPAMDAVRPQRGQTDLGWRSRGGAPRGACEPAPVAPERADRPVAGWPPSTDGPGSPRTLRRSARPCYRPSTYTLRTLLPAACGNTAGA